MLLNMHKIKFNNKPIHQLLLQLYHKQHLAVGRLHKHNNKHRHKFLLQLYLKQQHLAVGRLHKHNNNQQQHQPHN